MDSLEKLVSTQIRNRSTNTNVTAVTLRIPDEELISLPSFFNFYNYLCNAYFLLVTGLVHELT